MEILRVHDVTKTYGTGHTAVHAVRGVHLHVEPGEILLLMGPSGSGKTTLLTIAGGLLKPTSGTVAIDSRDITTLSERDLPAVRRTTLGFIFQSFNLLEALSAEENVAVPLLLSGVRLGAALPRARELLDRLGLAARRAGRPRELSGGEQQRVAIARALVAKPKVLLADEPTANLDSATGHEVMRMLCRIACEEHRAVVIVSHDQRLKDMAMRVLTMEDGRITREEPGGHAAWCDMPHHHLKTK
jgi:putative ABC transport system ATP-binding protein